jgi:hypothetical protein
LVSSWVHKNRESASERASLLASRAHATNRPHRSLVGLCEQLACCGNFDSCLVRLAYRASGVDGLQNVVVGVAADQSGPIRVGRGCCAANLGVGATAGGRAQHVVAGYVGDSRPRQVDSGRIGTLCCSRAVQIVDAVDEHRALQHDDRPCSFIVVLVVVVVVAKPEARSARCVVLSIDIRGVIWPVLSFDQSLGYTIAGICSTVGGRQSGIPVNGIRGLTQGGVAVGKYAGRLGAEVLNWAQHAARVMEQHGLGEGEQPIGVCPRSVIGAGVASANGAVAEVVSIVRFRIVEALVRCVRRRAKVDVVGSANSVERHLHHAGRRGGIGTPGIGVVERSVVSECAVSVRVNISTRVIHFRRGGLHILA